MNSKKISVNKIIAIVLLWIYVWFVLTMQSISVNVELYGIVIFFLFLASGLISYVCIDRLGNYLPKICEDGKRDGSYRIWILVSSITFLIFECYLAGQYPGGMSQDNLSQYAQALGESPYSNWHPVLHTLLFFTLPVKLGRGYGCILFLQILWFSLAFGYLVKVLYQNQCNRFLMALFCGYIWFNPYLATYLVYPWKDIAQMIFAMPLFGYYIQIIRSKGAWLLKKKNIFALTLMAVLCMYMRHNAVLFVAPLLILIMFYGIKNRKLRLVIPAVFVVGYVLVRLLYAGMDLEAVDRRTLETVGLPANVWCNVMKKNPDALPEETLAVMDQIATRENFKKKYTPGDFNRLKWSNYIDTSVIDEMSYGEILHYTYQCFKYAPKESWEAVAKLTDMVWAIDGKDEPVEITIKDNDWNVHAKPNRYAKQLTDVIVGLFSSGFGRILFGSIGCMMLTMLVITAIMIAKGRYACLHVIPLFVYNFGTMLLLSGPDYRYFLFNIVLWIPTIFLMLSDEQGWKKSEGINVHE
ncbi:MAG: DUF6020 family protein [Wujia sp.]